MTRFRFRDMPFRWGRFLLVDLVRYSWALIQGVTTSALAGLDWNAVAIETVVSTLHACMDASIYSLAPIGPLFLSPAGRLGPVRA